MSLPRPEPLPRESQHLSSDHLHVLGAIVTALGHLDLALLSTIRDLVAGADKAAVEALLAGDTTTQLAAKFERLVKQQHADESVVAQVVAWREALMQVRERWDQEFRSAWTEDRPDEALQRVRYTKTAYRGGLQVEQTSVDELRHILASVQERIGDLDALGVPLGLRPGG